MLNNKKKHRWKPPSCCHSPSFSKAPRYGKLGTWGLFHSKMDELCSTKRLLKDPQLCFVKKTLRITPLRPKILIIALKLMMSGETFFRESNKLTACLSWLVGCLFDYWIFYISRDSQMVKWQGSLVEYHLLRNLWKCNWLCSKRDFLEWLRIIMSNIRITCSSSLWLNRLKMKIRGANLPPNLGDLWYPEMNRNRKTWFAMSPVIPWCHVMISSNQYWSSRVTFSIAALRISGFASKVRHKGKDLALHLGLGTRKKKKSPSTSFGSNIFPKKMSLIADFHCPTLSRNEVPPSVQWWKSPTMVLLPGQPALGWTSRIQVLHVSWLR